jgi:hypothetical protein
MALGGVGIVVSFPLLGAGRTAVRNGKGERVGRTTTLERPDG